MGKDDYYWGGKKITKEQFEEHKKQKKKETPKTTTTKTTTKSKKSDWERYQSGESLADIRESKGMERTEPTQTLKGGRPSTTPSRKTTAKGKQPGDKEFVPESEKTFVQKYLWDPNAADVFSAENIMESVQGWTQAMTAGLMPAITSTISIIGRTIFGAGTKAVGAIKTSTSGYIGKGIITKTYHSNNLAKTIYATKGTSIVQGGMPVTASANVKTLTAAASTLGKIGISTTAIGVILAAGGSYPFAKFQLAEASDKIGIAMFRASQKGDTETVQKLAQLLKELTSPEVRNSIQQWIPGINLFDAIGRNLDAAAISAKVFDKLAKDESERITNGESEEEKWVKVKKEKSNDEKEMINYYNKERKKLLEWEAEAKAAQRNADAEFWRKERAKQRELEAADRKAMADFWLAYRKAAQKIADNNRPSNLNFGLL